MRRLDEVPVDARDFQSLRVENGYVPSGAQSYWMISAQSIKFAAGGEPALLEFLLEEKIGLPYNPLSLSTRLDSRQKDIR